jgi:hypothetical protein
LWGVKWKLVAQFLPYFGLLIFTQTLFSTIGHLLILNEKERAFMVAGWISAALMIIGIVAGAFISLIAIAQFYALAYITLVLIFNVLYLYIKVLNFKVKDVLLFWGPKITLSILLWLTIFMNLNMLKLVVLFFMVLHIIYSARREFKLILIKFKLIRE